VGADVVDVGGFQPGVGQGGFPPFLLEPLSGGTSAFGRFGLPNRLRIVENSDLTDALELVTFFTTGVNEA
jgi:hypothetical protein